MSTEDLSFEVPAGSWMAPPAADPSALVEQLGAHRQLLAALETLPARERDIIRSHYLLGVPFKTIAGTLGVTEPRVSQLHKRGVKLLREAIERLEQGEAA